MDGDRIFLHFGARNLYVWRGRRYSRHDYLHRSDVDLSRGSSNAAGRVERWRPNRCATPMFDGNLADVLHLGCHRQPGAGLQALDLSRHLGGREDGQAFLKLTRKSYTTRSEPLRTGEV